MTDSRNQMEHSPSVSATDAERIAALLDGRLDERAREEVLARLAASDDDFEAFVDALAVTRELEAEDGSVEGVTPLRPPARRWWRRPGGQWMALAAGLAGLALLPVLWMRSGGPDPDGSVDYPELLQDGQAGLPAGWDRSPWGTTRGPGDPLTPGARAVRLGARLTDLEVAVAARDPRAPALAEEIAAMLDGVPVGGGVAGLYRDIGRRSGEPPERLEPLLEQGRDATLRLIGPERAELLRLGAWTEAARIAAARRDAGFFRAPATGAVLDRTLDRTDPAAPVRPVLERIRRAVLPDGAPDWGSLSKDLPELLRILGR